MGVLCSAFVACVAPSALADSTITQTVGPGGTISTGSSVSAADPIQATLTSENGGTYTIDKVTSQPYVPFPGAGAEDEDGDGSDARGRWAGVGHFGPQFVITRHAPDYEDEVARLTFLIEGSVLPILGADNNANGTLINRRRSKEKGVWVCHSTRCRTVGALSYGAVFKLLPSGDVSVTNVTSQALQGERPIFHFGRWTWLDPKRIYYYAGDRPVPRGPLPLAEVLREGVGFAAYCQLFCYATHKLTVTRAVARALRLPSTILAQRTFASLALDVLQLPPRVKVALRRVGRVTVTATTSVRGLAPGQTWSDSNRIVLD
jgi:hypothetical protein